MKNVVLFLRDCFYVLRFSLLMVKQLWKNRYKYSKFDWVNDKLLETNPLDTSQVRPYGILRCLYEKPENIVKSLKAGTFDRLEAVNIANYAMMVVYNKEK